MIVSIPIPPTISSGLKCHCHRGTSLLRDPQLKILGLPDSQLLKLLSLLPPCYFLYIWSYDVVNSIVALPQQQHLEGPNPPLATFWFVYPPDSLRGLGSFVFQFDFCFDQNPLTVRGSGILASCHTVSSPWTSFDRLAFTPSHTHLRIWRRSLASFPVLSPCGSFPLRLETFDRIREIIA